MLFKKIHKDLRIELLSFDSVWKVKSWQFSMVPFYITIIKVYSLVIHKLLLKECNYIEFMGLWIIFQNMFYIFYGFYNEVVPP